MRHLKITAAVSTDSNRYDLAELLTLDLTVPDDMADATLAQIAAKIGKGAAGIVDQGIAVGGISRVTETLDRLMASLRDPDTDAKGTDEPEHDRTYVGDDEPVELERDAREPVTAG